MRKFIKNTPQVFLNHALSLLLLILIFTFGYVIRNDISIKNLADSLMFLLTSLIIIFPYVAMLLYRKLFKGSLFYSDGVMFFMLICVFSGLIFLFSY